MRVKCLRCGARLQAREELAGKRVKCPRCGEAIVLGGVPGVVEVVDIPEAVRVSPPGGGGEAAGGEAVRPGAEDEGEGRDVGSGWGPILVAAGFGITFLAWPVVALLFFAVFHQLIQSLVWGMVMAAGGVGVGIAGGIMSAAGRQRIAHRLSYVTVTMSFLTVALFIIATLLARSVSEQGPGGLPMVKQVIGTEAPQKLTMQCKQCGHEFEMTTTAFAMRHMGAVGELFKGYKDVDALLDKVEAEGEILLKCPKCGAMGVRAVMRCPGCKAVFEMTEAKATKDGKVRCPRCECAFETPLAGQLGGGLHGDLMKQLDLNMDGGAR